MGADGTRICVRCNDCSFERVVDPDDGVQPADVLVEHGQRTGHTLSIDRIEDEED
ncbi:hypothetical protein [Halorussus litoreus]|uniref:hypothetical protein n=1 Tax=Halorussus litoreus TaxID=1710536 RepID=UPI00130097AF|nr:hypothetical protein [Halorussus litoreus]